MKKLVDKKFDDGFLFRIYWDGERTLYVHEADMESERVLEVFLSPLQKVEEIYYHDSSIEDGKRPSFIED